MWIAKISGVTNFDAAISVDVSPEFAIGTIIEDVRDIRSISKFDARNIFASVEMCIKVAEIVPQEIDDIFDAFDSCKPHMIQINGDFFNDINNLITVQSVVTVPIIGFIALDKENLQPNILNPDPLEAVKILDQYVHAISLNLPLGEYWNDDKKKDQIIKLVEQIKQAISKPLIIGGGLNVNNVGDIIQNLQPEAVDISSGVEKLTGIKDPVLMQDFLETVYQYKDFLKGISINFS